MAPQAVHFKGASVKGKKRKEIGASKLTFDGRKKKEGPEKRRNTREDLNSKVSVVAEDDLDPDPFVYIALDLDGIDDKEFHCHLECCIGHRPSMTRELKEQEEMAKFNYSRNRKREIKNEE